jgi:hypothetical protein
MGDLVRPQSGQALAFPEDLADRLDQPHDRLAGGGSPDTVAPEQAHDLARPHLKVHALEDVALAVVGVQVADGEHQETSMPLPATGTPR